jgi:FkbM family methyltransferase
MITIGYIGNFGPAHSTENHVATDAEGIGYEVRRIQENTREAWDLDPAGLDLLLWTRTGWDWPNVVAGWTVEDAWAAQTAMLDRCRGAGVPTVGLHLDRWFGLDRQHQVDDEPFFMVDHLFTADGGHEEEWADRRIDHRWMPPAISAVEAQREGRQMRSYRADIAFVGNWSRYHAEYPDRRDLVASLRRRYRNRFRIWPRGRQAIRGQALADLYRTAKVIVGDSCLVPATNGEPIERYWSDRIPETLGRGGFLLHPRVAGIEDLFVDGEHLRLYDDREDLYRLIDYYLDHEDERRAIAAAGRDHVRAHHTYEHRIETIVTSILPGVASSRDRFRRDRLVASFDLRPDTSDRIVVDEIWTENVYKLDAADLRGQTVVDLGANVGAFSIFAALAGANAVHAYEPGWDNAQTLAANIKRNDLVEQVLLSCEAVTDGTAPTTTFVAGEPGGEGGSYTIDEAVEDAGVTVPAVGLDEVVRRAGHVGVMKIDVEGAEAAILCSASEETWERIDRIVLEFHGTETGAESALCDWEWRNMVEVLAEHGHVRILGRPSNGGMIWWDTYA